MEEEEEVESFRAAIAKCEWMNKKQRRKEENTPTHLFSHSDNLPINMDLFAGDQHRSVSRIKCLGEFRGEMNNIQMDVNKLGKRVVVSDM